MKYEILYLFHVERNGVIEVGIVKNDLAQHQWTAQQRNCSITMTKNYLI